MYIIMYVHSCTYIVLCTFVLQCITYIHDTYYYVYAGRGIGSATAEVERRSVIGSIPTHTTTSCYTYVHERVCVYMREFVCVCAYVSECVSHCV